MESINSVFISNLKSKNYLNNQLKNCVKINKIIRLKSKDYPGKTIPSKHKIYTEVARYNSAFSNLMQT